MSALPTGTVTFLFTDIEGSTRLWEEHPQTMHVALARHDALMRQAIEQNDGYIFTTVGDAFCAAFHTATDAFKAALSAQLALFAEAWPIPETIKVRMAVHTGAAELRDNDYFGQPLNRVARLMATGHGGQSLLSGTAQELLRDHLPADTALLDLGQRRLKDLGQPEHVFQVLQPSLPAAFPPLHSLDNPNLPNNLPQTVRQYARDRLKESGVSQAVRMRHGDYFLRLAEEVTPKLKTPEQARWLKTVTVRQTRGEEAFAAAWAQGRAMTLEQTITYALEDTAPQAFSNEDRNRNE